MKEIIIDLKAVRPIETFAGITQERKDELANELNSAEERLNEEHGASMGWPQLIDAGLKLCKDEQELAFMAFMIGGYIESHRHDDPLDDLLRAMVEQKAKND